jgi:hypothetical protein
VFELHLSSPCERSFILFWKLVADCLNKMD